MGVKARSNEPNSFRVYGDDVPSVWRDSQSGEIVEATTVHRTSHYCSRSGNQSMPLVSIGGGKRIRHPSVYYRQVMDSPHTYANAEMRGYQDRWWSGTRPHLWTQHGIVPITPKYADIANSSKATISGYGLDGNEDATNEAITKALNKLGDQKVNLSVALAEARKTFDMVADGTIALWNSYRNARRGNWAGAAKALGLSKKEFLTGKATADKLLAYKYGVQPTLRDLFDGYEYFAENRETQLLLRAKAASHRDTSFSSSWWDPGTQSWDGEVKQISFCSITATVSGEYQRSANRGGMLNPAVVAWELVPFSFLIDWFMPVGNVLQAYSDSAGLTFVSGYLGEVNRGAVDIRAHESWWMPEREFDMSGSARVEYFSTKRSPLSSFPRPGIYNKQGWFNKNKGATALALFRSVAFK